MTALSRNLFVISLIFGAGGILLTERLPEWWGPTSIFAVVLTASIFLTCSVVEYRRGRTAVDPDK
jgi:hypothetical protein